jgi:hypothetical protein
MPGYKPRALLAYLLVTGRAHSRQHLVDLLVETSDDPRASLRWTLSKLRKAIGSDYLLADRGALCFEFNTSTTNVYTSALSFNVLTFSRSRLLLFGFRRAHMDGYLLSKLCKQNTSHHTLAGFRSLSARLLLIAITYLLFQNCHQRLQGCKPLPLSGARVFQPKAPHRWYSGILAPLFPKGQQIGSIARRFVKDSHPTLLGRGFTWIVMCGILD